MNKTQIGLWSWKCYLFQYVLQQMAKQDILLKWWKVSPGNLSSRLGFITCLRGKFEDEWRVARVLSPLLHQMQVTQPPPPTRAVDPERGKQGGERWAESNNISTPNNHIFYLFVYTVCTFKAFFVCLVVAFEAEKTAASWQVSEWYNISLIFFPPAQSLQL